MKRGRLQDFFSVTTFLDKFHNDSEDDMSEEKAAYKVGTEHIGTTTGAGSSAGTGFTNAEPHNWDKLSIEAKIERMRWVVKARLDNLERRVESLTEKVEALLQHKHLANDEQTLAIGIDNVHGLRHFGVKVVERDGQSDKEFF